MSNSRYIKTVLKGKKNGLLQLKHFLLVVFAIILLTWLCKAFFFSVYRVPTESMVPAIQLGSYILVLKFPYRLRTPDYWPLTGIPFPFFSIRGISHVEQGDVVVFNDPLASATTFPSLREHLVKRCIGLPGDTVRVFAHHTNVNGKTIDHRQNAAISLNSDSLLQQFILPASSSHSFFMAGDNRTQSFDSRYFGLVPERNLIGQAVAVIWPWPPHWLK